MMNKTRFCVSPTGDFAGLSDSCYWGLPSIEASSRPPPPLLRPISSPLRRYSFARASGVLLRQCRAERPDLGARLTSSARALTLCGARVFVFKHRVAFDPMCDRPLTRRTPLWDTGGDTFGGEPARRQSPAHAPTAMAQ